MRLQEKVRKWNCAKCFDKTISNGLGLPRMCQWLVLFDKVFSHCLTVIPCDSSQEQYEKSGVKNFFMPPAFVPGAKLGGVGWYCHEKRRCLTSIQLETEWSLDSRKLWDEDKHIPYRSPFLIRLIPGLQEMESPATKRDPELDNKPHSARRRHEGEWRWAQRGLPNRLTYWALAWKISSDDLSYSEN